MTSDESQYLTTGEVAKLCSVKADTVLKWIKKGRLAATRTAGGHHRIDRREVSALMEHQDAAPVPPCARRPLRCWEYLSEGGAVRDACKACSAYRVRAAWCFEMLSLPGGAGHARQFCKTSCAECVYFQRIKGSVTRVLVVSRDREMVRKLDAEKSEDLSLRFARNGYEASALVESFQPAFVIVDAELPGREYEELVSCLSHDARVPGLKVFLAAPCGCESTSLGNGVTGVLVKPFGHHGIRAAVESVEVEGYAAAYDGTASPQQ